MQFEPFEYVIQVTNAYQFAGVVLVAMMVLIGVYTSIAATVKLVTKGPRAFAGARRPTRSITSNYCWCGNCQRAIPPGNTVTCAACQQSSSQLD